MGPGLARRLSRVGEEVRVVEQSDLIAGLSAFAGAIAAIAARRRDLAGAAVGLAGAAACAGDLGPLGLLGLAVAAVAVATAAILSTRRGVARPDVTLAVAAVAVVLPAALAVVPGDWVWLAAARGACSGVCAVAGLGGALFAGERPSPRSTRWVGEIKIDRPR